MASVIAACCRASAGSCLPRSQSTEARQLHCIVVIEVNDLIAIRVSAVMRPKSAPGVPVLSSCNGLPTKPPGTTGGTSIKRLVVALGVWMPISAFAITRSPFLRRAALSGVLKGASVRHHPRRCHRRTREGRGRGGRCRTRAHCPSTITPFADARDAKADTVGLVRRCKGYRSRNRR